jgi:homoaconitase
MSVLLRRRVGKVLVARRYLATHAPLKEKDCTSITPPYGALQDKLALVRKLLDNRPLTLAEKILYSHLADPEKTISGGGLKRGETYLLLHPQVCGCFSSTAAAQIPTSVDRKRVAMQDASAQYVFLSYFPDAGLLIRGMLLRMAL